MPYALIIIGLVMIVTAANNTHAQMAAQLKTDFSDTQFLKGSAAIAIVGAAGYIEDLRGLSRAFMALIVVAMILGNKGVIQKFQDALQQGPQAITPASEPSSGGPLDPVAALKQQQQGAFGQEPTSTGQAKANGWFNYLFGGSTSTPNADTP